MINEDLNILKKEDSDSKATAQAKSLGLQYVGFGRYEDPKSGQITHIVQNDKLVPFSRAIKSKSFQQQSSDDIGTYGKLIQPDIDQLHADLVNHYSADKYQNNEINAIQTFTSGGYADINSKLASLPSGIPSKNIEPSSMDDNLSDTIGWLDSALKKSRTPKEMYVYYKLGDSYDIDDFKEGITFTDKIFRSASINPTTVIKDINPTPSKNGRQTVYILQIKVKKNNKGMYVSDFSGSPDEGEFVFPRNTKFTVTGIPQRLVGSDGVSGNMNLEIQYLDCQSNS